MLEYRNGSLEYSVSHLRGDIIETYDKIIERFSELQTNLLYNIVSSPECRYEKYHGRGRIMSDFTAMSAEERFKNIFTSGMLYGNPKSYFVNKTRTGHERLDDIRSVSFALADYSEVPLHFKARGSEFGICFFHDFLQDNGLRKVEYLNENDEQTKEKIIFNSPHLVEVYSESYDMRWEKEYRIKGDLRFSGDDIAFVIVPKSKYDYYVDWFLEQSQNGDGYEFPIITSETYTSPLDHMLYLPLMDNGWGQINIGNREFGKYKISPEDLPILTQDERTAFFSENEVALTALAKNTILTSYEDRFTSRFSEFLSKINYYSLGSDMVKHIENIRQNKHEPHESERDLVHSLYTKLHGKLASNGRLGSLL